MKFLKYKVVQGKLIARKANQREEGCDKLGRKPKQKRNVKVA